MPMISFGGAKHDVWLSAVLATTLGLAGGYLIITLGLRYPSQTVIQYSQQIVGRWLGGFICLLYITFFLLIATMATRDFAELYLTYIMPETPIYIFTGVILLMAAYASVNGLEVIARIAEIFVPIILFVTVLGILFNIPNMNFLMLLPALEDGWRPVIVDAIVEVPYLGLVVSWLFLLPSLNIKTGAKKTLLLSIAIVGLAMFLVSIAIVMVIGPDIPVRSNYQFYTIFRLINIANSIQRIEPLFLVAWTCTGFLTATFFYYATVASIKQWLGLNTYRPLILPIGVIIFSLSILMFSSYIDLRKFFSLELFGMIAIPVEFGIPLLLLGVVYVKEKIIK